MLLRSFQAIANMPKISLVVTSCGRHDLLERTLRSFDKFNTYPIEETIISEDGDSPAPAWLEDLPNLGPKTWISHGKRKGQIYSVDRAYAEVKTDFVMHVEDDWEFFRHGFIEESLGILEEYPNIVQCSIRDDWDHPSVTIPDFPFPINQPDWREGWSGFCFNPGLRRLADYKRIGSYGRHVSYFPHFVGELELSKLYRNMGFYAAALPAACKHIGEGSRHIPWQTAPKAARVLIAVPACHRHNYESHSDTSIHQNNATDERIEAVRATWANYVKSFNRYVDIKFFYGEMPEGIQARQAESDEVFLPVPDAYDSLPIKVQAIYKWALERSFDYTFKADDDTFVYVDRLLASGFENYDYLGYCTSDQRQPLKDRYASGGSGYFVSQKAMKILAAATVDDWAEDRWVGKVLFEHDIKAIRDPRYLPGFDRHYIDLEALPEPNSYISFHACSPAMMKKLYERPANPTFKLLTHAMNEGTHLTTHSGLNVTAKERVEKFEVIRRTIKGLRVLVAIVGCHKRQSLRDAQRQTWVKEIHKHGLDYRFFLGNFTASKPPDPRRGHLTEYGPKDAPAPLADEVFLNVPDTYEALPLKTHAMLKWAHERGYDFVFKCDDDTYCSVERLIDSGFERLEYSGFQRSSEYFGTGVVYAQGGAGYWLSRAAMALVIAEEPVLESGPEDINVARILSQHGIELTHDARYSPTMAWTPGQGNKFITAHKCKPEDLLTIHQRFEQVQVA